MSVRPSVRLSACPVSWSVRHQEVTSSLWSINATRTRPANVSALAVFSFFLLDYWPKSSRKVSQQLRRYYYANWPKKALMECIELAYTGNSQLHGQCDTKRPDILLLLLLSFLFSLILLPSNSFICLLSSFYRTLSVLHRIVFRAVRCSQTECQSARYVPQPTS